MFTIKKIHVAAIITSMALFVTSCKDKTEPATEDTKLEEKTVANIDSKNEDESYDYYSLEEGKEVAASEQNTTTWDIGFRSTQMSTDIVVNNGDFGPGKAEVAVVENAGAFDEITEVPADAKFGTTIAPTWYTYTGNNGGMEPQHAIVPNAGTVFFIKTANGKYAKLKILSYYKDSPTPLTNKESLDPTLGGYFTFKYVFQPDGTKKF